MEKYFGQDIFKLGFGLMRLPRLEDGKTIDIEQTKKMVDRFIEGGGTYFDTAYVYDNSEVATKEALVDRYPRESYTLATKLNVMMQCTDEASAKQEFFTSLERTGAGYFDYYLLHAMSERNVQRFEEWGIWDFVKEQKAKGLIKHIGFSFHDTPELLDQILTAHPETEFVQMQINYADWENPGVQSRGCYEVARKHGKSIVVMEPVKGGTLANPPAPVQEVFRAKAADVSFASWAIRFVASQDGIITVLSGMSNMEQVEDNMSYMSEFQPLDASEQQVIADAQAALAKIPQIQCTSCRYCVGGCPQEIPIPSIFSAMNKELIFGQTADAKRSYGMATGKGGQASSCVECGQCETQCPQNLPIIDLLKDCAAKLEG